MQTLFMLLMAPVFALYRGWVLWILWGWFAPISWGAMPWVNAVGVAYITSYLVTQDTKTDRTVWEAFTFPLIVLAVSFVLHLCGVRGV